MRDQLNGQEWQVKGSADSSNPDVQGLMDHVNLDLLYSGSQSLVSDLEVSYAVHLKSFEDHMADDFHVNRLCAALDTQTDGSCDYVINRLHRDFGRGHIQSCHDRFPNGVA